MVRKPAVGHLVHYVLPSWSRCAGECRAAIVTNAFGGTPANLTVFLDQHDDAVADGPVAYSGLQVVESCRFIAKAWSIEFNAEKRPGTWHWPELTAGPIDPRNAVNLHELAPEGGPSEADIQRFRQSEQDTLANAAGLSPAEVKALGQ